MNLTPPVLVLYECFNVEETICHSSGPFKIECFSFRRLWQFLISLVRSPQFLQLHFPSFSPEISQEKITAAESFFFLRAPA